MVHISRHISKLGDAAISIGLLPGVTCRPNAPCLKKCYACKGRYRTRTVHNNLVENTKEWFEHPAEFQDCITDACLTCKWFRWFHAGDIPDKPFLKMMFDIAEDIPSTNYLAFTKKDDLVNEYLDEREQPANLTLVLSAWGDELIPNNPHNLPVAYVRLKGKKCYIPHWAKPCNGSCEHCIKMDGGGCWKLQHGEAVVFDEH